MIGTGVMLAMLMVAVVTDLRTGKVYNWLTAPAALVGLALAIGGGGLPAVGNRLLAAAMVLGAAILLRRAAPLGGGDIKLLVAVGALQGFGFTLWAVLFTGIFGGLLAAAVMVRRRAVGITMFHVLAATSQAGGSPLDLAAGSVGGRIPYSIAIALGAVSALALKLLVS